jgi:hypothetical protein
MQLPSGFEGLSRGREFTIIQSTKGVELSPRHNNMAEQNFLFRENTHTKKLLIVKSLVTEKSI